ncbi:MAG: hypothetical protein ABJO36_05005 [Litorimonas sp.]
MSPAGTNRERHLAQSLPGRGQGSRRPGISNVLFRPITLICLLLIGFFAFGALIVLGGFAKDLRKAPPGQATPRSVSAVGYQALTDYLDQLNYDVRETRGKREYYDRDERLVIYTPSRPTRRLSRILESEGEAVNLVILPKWSVGQMIPQRGEDGQKGWARKTSGSGLYYPTSYDSMMDDLPVLRRHDVTSADAQVFFTTPRTRNLSESYQPDFKDLQYFDLNTRWPDYQDELREIRRQEFEDERRKAAEARGETYEPKEKKEKKKNSESDDKEKEEKKEEEAPKPLPNHEVILKLDGFPVLIQLEGTQTYVLSEPDLVNTMAFNTQGGAQLTNTIIDEIIYDSSTFAMSMDFDVSLHGIESNRNIIKLMVTPPFLAATLCLLAAGGLVAWQGFNRFGDPARLRPDYAQGPVSLAETAADFMGIANRAHKTGEDYAALIRRQVAAELGYKNSTTDHIDKLLDAREKRLKIQPIFADLKRAIASADTQSYGQYARALTTWRDAMTHSDFPQGPQDS